MKIKDIYMIRACWLVL